MRDEGHSKGKVHGDLPRGWDCDRLLSSLKSECTPREDFCSPSAQGQVGFAVKPTTSGKGLKPLLVASAEDYKCKTLWVCLMHAREEQLSQKFKSQLCHDLRVLSSIAGLSFPSVK